MMSGGKKATNLFIAKDYNSEKGFIIGQSYESDDEKKEDRVLIRRN